MTIRSTDLSDLGRPGLEFAIEQYRDAPETWKSIFQTKNTKHREVPGVEMYGPSRAVRKVEGESVAQTSIGISSRQSFTHDVYGMSFNITREAQEDNLYTEYFKASTDSLVRSLKATKDQVAANIFNQGHTELVRSVDGVPMISENHPTRNGNDQSNLLNVALSEIGLQRAITGIRKFTDVSGMQISVKPKALLVNSANMWAADILLRSSLSPSQGVIPAAAGAGDVNSGRNDINTMHNKGYFPGGFIVLDSLVSENFAAVLTDVNSGLMHFQRSPATTKSWVDEPTSSTWYSASERYSFGVIDWRSIYCLST